MSRRAQPRYVRIAEALRRRIRASGHAGRRLPSEHALCARFGVSRMTVRQALEVLRQEGLLSRHVGRGTFTAPAAAARRRIRMIGSVEDMLALGEETWFEPVEAGLVRPPRAVAQALGQAPGARVVRVSGVRYASGCAFQHVAAYLPAELGQGILEADLSKTSVIGAVEREMGVRVRYIEQAIVAVRCPRAVAERLGGRAGSPILRFSRTYVTADGAPVEHAVTHHWAERYPYRMMLFRSDGPFAAGRRRVPA